MGPSDTQCHETGDRQPCAARATTVSAMRQLTRSMSSPRRNEHLAQIRVSIQGQNLADGQRHCALMANVLREEVGGSEGASNDRTFRRHD
jgi:hypothetical protein